MRLLLLAAALLASFPVAAAGPDVPEPGTSEAIRAATTEPRFLSPWVASLPDSATVPSPSDFLGRIAGAPGELATAEQAHAYFRKLAEASPRAKLILLGKTEEGRDILALAIADEDGIKDFERLKAATASLADPRKTTLEQAAQLVAESRPFYYFNAGLHADETGSTEATMELAYRLLVSEDAGTVADSGGDATHGARKRGSVVAARIASLVPGSGTTGPAAATGKLARSAAARRSRRMVARILACA